MQQSWDVVADSLRSAPFQTAIRMYGTDESNGKTTAGRECFDMLYRKMPRIEEKLSILGFGAMRLPVNADGSVDDKTVDVMMHKAIEGGINYVDTAWPYHGGKGEDAVGRALRGGLRDKVMLVTKMPSGSSTPRPTWSARSTSSSRSCKRTTSTSTCCTR